MTNFSREELMSALPVRRKLSAIRKRSPEAAAYLETVPFGTKVIFNATVLFLDAGEAVRGIKKETGRIMDPAVERAIGALAEAIQKAQYEIVNSSVMFLK